MKNHIFQVEINSQLNSSPAQFKDLKHLIRESELDKLIGETFPLNEYDSESNLLINGSKELLLYFEKVDEEKLDIVEELKNIEYIGLSDDYEIILRFNNELFDEDFNATGIYDFSYDFLDNAFNMGKFSKFCISNSYNDLLRENITQLFEKLPSLKKQYRLIKNRNEWFLRGLTSTRYNNYDNHLAIYLTLISLHKYSKANQTSFNLEKAYLSDSEIKIFFSQQNPIKIPNLGEIYFGVYVSNNEIKEGTFSLELRYTVVNEQGKSFSGLSNYVFNINHSTGISNVQEKLSFSDRINELKDINIQHITSIKMNKLSDNQLFMIFKKIHSSTQKLSKEARDKAKDYYNSTLVNNTLTIIEAFDKFNEITTDVEERIYLERIYNEVLKELSDN
ncbi:hypothetical protein BK742_21855 [Bacillus thuringiensis serovar pingluonsis]|uniref:Uncharacterized protein n=1 Tax=Bacillus thuringiensis serovar pingluonsis TaxID=180881 RepID=A0A243B4Y7_BACTU|nr:MULTISPECIES: hypothetical protein [Bacillus cereus group]MEB9684081.1 hypothetical protein [Bacillus anthracis]OTY39569.1 hypothetical protein BK742_21855 [Bacillus thuringiensis serovar pingluonsis]